MSDEMGSTSNAVTIYIPLLNEGTIALRPTLGIVISKGVYKVLPTADYAECDEEWEFPPGSLVECVVENRDGKQVLFAHRNVTIS